MDFCSGHEGSVRRERQCSQHVLVGGLSVEILGAKDGVLTLISIQASMTTIEMAICRTIDPILHWWAHAEARSS